MINKKTVVCIVLIHILNIANFTGCIEEQQSRVILHGKGEYNSIQTALDNAIPGDFIYVYDGTYEEDIIINITINLIGQNQEKVIIYSKTPGTTQKSLITVAAENCTIKGFTLLYSNNVSGTGITIYSSNNTITNNSIMNCSKGISIETKSSHYNKITSNKFVNNDLGIEIRDSDNNLVYKNKILYSNQYGIYVYSSNTNNIDNNYIANSETGVRIKGSRHNIITKNNITDNENGLYFCCGSHQNEMWNNLFYNNKQWHVCDSLNNEVFKVKKGNYYDDYIEKYQNATDNDGIWSIPYELFGGSVDQYPLVAPFEFDI